jgi:riboflavin kinase/FMN adenylyltransferase
VAKIIIGYDHKFGKNRAADFNDLKAFGAKFGFEVEEISAQQINAIAISSTKIRMALQEGNIELANQYLGYPYMLSGKVLKGNQLGRTIGFPTANIHLTETYKLIPKIGVYVVAVYIENNAYYGMMNIGTRPTIDGQNLSIEVHIFNFEQTIYDASIKVHMFKKLRDEQKFESLEILKNQLHQDKIDALAYISKLKIK